MRQRLGELRTEVAGAGVEVGLEERRDPPPGEHPAHGGQRRCQFARMVGVVVHIDLLRGVHIELETPLDARKRRQSLAQLLRIRFRPLGPRGAPHRGHRGHQRAQRDQQILQARAAHDERHAADEQIDQAGSQVGLGHDASEGDEDVAKSLQILTRIVEVAAIAREHARIEQDNRYLGELARLQLHTDVDPTLRTLRLDADDRQMRRKDQRHIHDQEQRSVARKLAIIDRIEDHHGHRAQAHAHQLARERIVLVALDRRPHHQKAVGDQAERHSDEGFGNGVDEPALAPRRAVGRTRPDDAAFGRTNAIDLVESGHASRPFLRPYPGTERTA